MVVSNRTAADHVVEIFDVAGIAFASVSGAAPWQAPERARGPIWEHICTYDVGSSRLRPKRRQPFCLLLADRLPNRVLHAADGILNLALGLLSLSFRFRLLVAQKLAGCFLDATRKLLERPFDTIFVHHQQAFSRYVYVVNGRYGYSPVIRASKSLEQPKHDRDHHYDVHDGFDLL